MEIKFTYDDEFIVRFYAYFSGCELLHVQNNLELVLLHVDGGSRVLLADVVGSVVRR